MQTFLLFLYSISLCLVSLLFTNSFCVNLESDLGKKLKFKTFKWSYFSANINTVFSDTFWLIEGAYFH